MPLVLFLFIVRKLELVLWGTLFTNVQETMLFIGKVEHSVKKITTEDESPPHTYEKGSVAILGCTVISPSGACLGQLLLVPHKVDLQPAEDKRSNCEWESCQRGNIALFFLVVSEMLSL